LRTGSIGDPKINVTVEVPIGQREHTAIVDEIQTRRGRDVGKSSATGIQKTAVALVTTERSAGS
jgi:hypothetical protein